MELEQAGLAALQQLQSELTAPSAAAPPDLAESCRRYHRLQPLLEQALALLERLPLLGKGTVAALRFLMQLADLVCPAAPAVAAAPARAVAAAIPSAPPPLQPEPVSPGHERWAVKTGADPGAAAVAMTFPVPTTVEELRREPRPREFPDMMEPFSLAASGAADERAHPVETTIWTVDARITDFRLEKDGDYHLVIHGSSGKSMIAEIPRPDPEFVDPASPWRDQIAQVRQSFLDQFGLAEQEFSDTSFTSVDQRARITGVGFFDFDHGQKGRAPNVLELHPVIGIEWL